MIKHAIITACAVMSFAAVQAQNPGMKLTDITNADNSLHIIAEPSGYGSFTVWLTINSVSNGTNVAANVQSVIMRTINGKAEIFALQPDDASIPVRADYTYDWIQGKVNALPDLGFVYRVPLADGATTTVRSITPMQAGMMRDNTSNFRIWQFSAKEGAPVFAMRKGTVIRIEGAEPAAAGQDEFGSGLILVEHADGTQAYYSGLKGSSVTVAEGDTVVPSQRIGTAGKFLDGTTGVRVGLYTYITNRNRGAYPNMWVQSDFINPLFSLSSGNNILSDGITVTAKASKKVLDAENGSVGFWQKIFGR